MSIETVNKTNPPNEYPDIVGAKPDNPYLASFRPYIPASVKMRELTLLPLIVGTLLGMVFGASSLYLVLKVGLTVSASIPVAVISITLFRVLSKLGLRNATILENNIVQTAGSAGESIAFGVGVTMPAILILGFDLELTRVLLVAVLGGLLGILMMIPLRRALIVQQHGVLKYPEGTACAEVLKAGASDESRAMSIEAAHDAGARDESGSGVGARTIFTGFGIGLVYQVCMAALKGWKTEPTKIFGAPFNAGSISAEISPALLGVGYIIGPRIASIMAAGGVLSFLVLIPAIKFFGENVQGVVPPGTIPIREMDPYQIYNAYILYIGAGAVAAGGIISLFRSLPTIWHGLKGGLKDLRGGQAATGDVPRTDQDLSMKFVIAGIIGLVVLIMIARTLHMNLLGAILIIVFGFLFVTVSSRLTGEIGSSSNPISGMTVATLLLTCLVFLVIGWTGPLYYVTALSVGAIVCIAASNGGTTSQDLKTGFLVGSTPRLQQIAIIVGALASAVILGPILLQLNDAATVYVSRVSFEPVANGATVEGTTAAGLPAYTEEFKPREAGSYRILNQGEGATAAVPDLQPGEYLVDQSGRIAYRVRRNFTPELRADVSQLPEAAEKLHGPQGEKDPNSYYAWHKVDDAGGAPGKYLVDSAGVPVYFVDPGINGSHRITPEGTTVDKFRAPKATLMSYIIKGILNRQLPWGLVLLGVMIAIVLEMSGIPSLAFAVGVYLPLASSSPIFFGGMVRWLVDKNLRRKLKHKNLSEDELIAEGDKSPGVLMASGYIAGGALASIIIAFMAGVLTRFNQNLEEWSTASNPFYYGGNSDLLSMIPFAVLIILLYLVGREALLGPRKGASS
ncbi:MAG TPA: oligopeptide transporter, OPT family [Blastocatellia bacterium]|jgi:putative OPT family oligopeptide transporter|nr:oligopeptide transporter, OPT family [Blastocatellia bacterium]